LFFSKEQRGSPSYASKGEKTRNRWKGKENLLRNKQKGGKTIDMCEATMWRNQGGEVVCLKALY